MLRVPPAFGVTLAVAIFTRAAIAGVIVGPVPFTTDAGSGISASNTYTHLLDFPSTDTPGALIPAVNGVPFTAAGKSGTIGGHGWSSTGLTAEIDSNGTIDVGAPLPVANTQGSYKLLADSYFNNADAPGNRSETVTLTGLTPGVTYDARVYYRANDNLLTRNEVLTFDEGAGSPKSLTVNENGDLTHADYLSYVYTSGPGGTLTMTFTDPGTNSVIIAPQNGSVAVAWYQYGLTNQVVGVPEPSAWVAGVLGLAAWLLIALRRRNGIRERAACSANI